MRIEGRQRSCFVAVAVVDVGRSLGACDLPAKSRGHVACIRLLGPDLVLFAGGVLSIQIDFDFLVVDESRVLLSFGDVHVSSVTIIVDCN